MVYKSRPGRASIPERAGLLILILCALPGMVCAQDKPSAQQLAAPPMKALTREERTQLESVKDEKSRVKRTLEFMATRLKNAEERATKQKYDSALSDLGGYLALLDDALDFLSTMNHDSKKARDLYKQIELALRADAPRLTVIRRDTPFEYAGRVKEVEERAREGRTEALNSFYGQTVVRERSKKDDEKPKDTSKPEGPPQ